MLGETWPPHAECRSISAVSLGPALCNLRKLERTFPSVIKSDEDLIIHHGRDTCRLVPQACPSSSARVCRLSSSNLSSVHDLLQVFHVLHCLQMWIFCRLSQHSILLNRYHGDCGIHGGLCQESETFDSVINVDTLLPNPKEHPLLLPSTCVALRLSLPLPRAPSLVSAPPVL